MLIILESEIWNSYVLMYSKELIIELFIILLFKELGVEVLKFFKVGIIMLICCYLYY